MKKLLGIVVLGLLLSGNAYAGKYLCISNDIYVVPYYIVTKFNEGEKPTNASCIYKIDKNLNNMIYNELSNSSTVQKNRFNQLIGSLTQTDTSQRTVKTTKKDKKQNLSIEQTIEIEQLKEMFDIGALTKEEYDTAIKRVLN